MYSVSEEMHMHAIIIILFRSYEMTSRSKVFQAAYKTD